MNGVKLIRYIKQCFSVLIILWNYLEEKVPVPRYYLRQIKLESFDMGTRHQYSVNLPS